MDIPKDTKKPAQQKKLVKNLIFFSKFSKNFIDRNKNENYFEINFQDVSNDKYLKLYKIDSNLVDYNIETLKNSINYSHERDDLLLILVPAPMKL